VTDDDENGNGVIDCLDPAECNDDCTCTGATLISDDPNDGVKVGAQVVLTAAATCTGTGTPLYKFRVKPPNGVWTVVQRFGRAQRSSGRRRDSNRVVIASSFGSRRRRPATRPRARRSSGSG
jgi:hypothetical protein